MKLVQKEAESEAVRRYLRRHRWDERVTSALSRVEVVRALQAAGAPAVAKARRQLARMHQVNIDSALLDAAATLAPGMILRSLDAIHLASAQLVGAGLRAVVTYDHRMETAGAALGFSVVSPS